MLEPPKVITCGYIGCDKPVTNIAAGRVSSKIPRYFCEDHAQIVANEQEPEYVVSCPNCGCRFGVN